MKKELAIMTEAPNHKAEIYYYDIGDYLSREQKLDIIASFKSMKNLPFTRLKPNEHGDWISQRNDKFGTWISIGDKDNKDNKSTFFAPVYSRGLVTARDSWCYCFSKKQLESQMRLSIDFYNEQRKLFANEKAKNPTANARAFVSYDDSKLSWNRGILNYCEKNKTIDFENDSVRLSLYRPFCKQNSYFNVAMNDMTYQLDKHFPSPNTKNLVICTKGVGDKDFSCLISEHLPDLQVIFNGQCFPLYWYETIEPEQNSLFGDDAQIVRHEAVSDFILERAQGKYGNKVQKEDIFYYVYGILHSKSYRKTFCADLKKMLPRIPLISDYEKFWAFSKAGRKLANLHLNYEQIAAYQGLTIESLENKEYEVASSKNTPGGELFVAEKPKAGTSNSEYEYYEVCQMKFPKKGQKDTIIYNHYHTVKNIPQKAYEYVVNGKSAIEWIMERYAVTTDKKSGITNNPNDWSREHEKPRYILDLLLSIVNVSVQTADIVDALPDVDWEKE